MSYVIDGREQAIIHIEINALGNSNKLGGTSLECGYIYITHFPYINCFKSICTIIIMIH